MGFAGVELHVEDGEQRSSAGVPADKAILQAAKGSQHGKPHRRPAGGVTGVVSAAADR
jgi:hypothetical protein